jgi:hypothetical protein
MQIGGALTISAAVYDTSSITRFPVVVPAILNGYNGVHVARNPWTTLFLDVNYTDTAFSVCYVGATGLTPGRLVSSKTDWYLGYTDEYRDMFGTPVGKRWFGSLLLGRQTDWYVQLTQHTLATSLRFTKTSISTAQP